jgi:hypothetical protein
MEWIFEIMRVFDGSARGIQRKLIGRKRQANQCNQANVTVMNAPRAAEPKQCIARLSKNKGKETDITVSRVIHITKAKLRFRGLSPKLNKVQLRGSLR